MFYPVKIIDDEGKVKRTFNSKELSRRYWEAFYNDMSGENTSKIGKVKSRKKINIESNSANILIASN